MPKFSRVFGSMFPGRLVVPGEHKDVDNTVAPIITQIQELIASNQMEEAKNLYSENEELLKPYSVNAMYLNGLEEEMHNLEALLMSKCKSMISDMEPAGMEDGSFWLEEY